MNEKNNRTNSEWFLKRGRMKEANQEEKCGEKGIKYIWEKEKNNPFGNSLAWVHLVACNNSSLLVEEETNQEILKRKPWRKGSWRK